MADILIMVNPVAFSHSTRIKQYAHTIVKNLSLEDSWHYDLAAMLCQLGYISLPEELVHKVADMVTRQNDEMGKIEFQGKLSNQDKGILGGQILRVAIAYEKLISEGMDEQAAIKELKDDPAHYDPVLVETLILSSQNRKIEVMKLPIDKQEPGLILDQPIKTQAGTLLVAKGQVSSQVVLFRLLAAQESGIVSDMVRVT